MPEPLKTLTLILVRLRLLVVAIHLIGFYLRLGFLLASVWLTGAFLAFLMTPPERRNSADHRLPTTATLSPRH